MDGNRYTASARLRVCICFLENDKNLDTTSSSIEKLKIEELESSVEGRTSLMMMNAMKNNIHIGNGPKSYTFFVLPTSASCHADAKAPFKHPYFHVLGTPSKSGNVIHAQPWCTYSVVLQKGKPVFLMHLKKKGEPGWLSKEMDVPHACSCICICNLTLCPPPLTPC